MNRSMTHDLMLVIPLKVTKRYDMSPPLSAWIDDNKNLKATSHHCKEDLLRLSSIRNCISSSICQYYAHKKAISDNAMKDSIEYHAILLECENLGFPVKENLGVSKMKISWDCAFQRGGQPMIRSNIRHERICVLFNIGALESYLASIEDLQSKQGLAKAVQRFNTAAGIFHHISSELIPKDDPKSTIDISLSCLQMCEKLLLAQGQACVYDMARTHSKPVHSILAKLAMGAAELYAEAVLKANERMVQSQMTDSKLWMSRMKLQSATFRALAEFHEAVVAKQDASKTVGAYGKEIARLQLTETLCNDGIALGKSENLELLKRYVIERRLDAEKDNKELYRELIPSPRTLPPSPGHRMVKPLPLMEILMPSSLNRPLFSKLK